MVEVKVEQAEEEDQGDKACSGDRDRFVQESRLGIRDQASCGRATGIGRF